MNFLLLSLATLLASALAEPAYLAVKAPSGVFEPVYVVMFLDFLFFEYGETPGQDLVSVEDGVVHWSTHDAPHFQGTWANSDVDPLQVDSDSKVINRDFYVCLNPNDFSRYILHWEQIGTPISAGCSYVDAYVVPHTNITVPTALAAVDSASVQESLASAEGSLLAGDVYHTMPSCAPSMYCGPVSYTTCAPSMYCEYTVVSASPAVSVSDFLPLVSLSHVAVASAKYVQPVKAESVSLVPSSIVSPVTQQLVSTISLSAADRPSLTEQASLATSTEQSSLASLTEQASLASGVSLSGLTGLAADVTDFVTSTVTVCTECEHSYVTEWKTYTDYTTYCPESGVVTVTVCDETCSTTTITVTEATTLTVSGTCIVQETTTAGAESTLSQVFSPNITTFDNAGAHHSVAIAGAVGLLALWV